MTGRLQRSPGLLGRLLGLLCLTAAICGCASRLPPDGQDAAAAPPLPSAMFAKAVALAGTPGTRAAWQDRLNAATRLATEQAQAGMTAGPDGQMPQLRAGCYADLACFIDGRILALSTDTSGPDELAAALNEADEAARPLREQLIALDAAVDRESDPHARLEAMVARDQTLRGFFGQSVQAAQGGRPADVMLMNWVRTITRQSDILNAAYLWQQVQAAPEATRAQMISDFWLIVQHADRRPALQQYAIGLLGTQDPNPLAGRDWAMLEDRFLLNGFGRQKYGTQVQCVEGRWQRPGLPPQAETDANRALVNLPPLPEERRQPGGPCHF